MSIDLVLDQIKTALNILNKNDKVKNISNNDWNNLFTAKGYQMLKQREKDMDNNFTDSILKEFLLDEETSSNLENYNNSLNRFLDIDLDHLISKTKKYLPQSAEINTAIIPVIKPESNSFVHSINERLLLFIYLEPNISKDKLENKLIHELHHVGLDDVYNKSDYSHLTAPAQKMIEWTNAFGEGFAMLAAAGIIDEHPNNFSEESKKLWDENIKNFNTDFKKIENFLLNILYENFHNDKELYNKGFELMVSNGGQGSWYTVGYKIAKVIEKTANRKVLIDCMDDLTKLYTVYNELVLEYNKKQKGNLKHFHNDIIRGLKGIKNQ